MAPFSGRSWGMRCGSVVRRSWRFSRRRFGVLAQTRLRTVGLMSLWWLVSLLGCGTRVIYVRSGDPVRLAEPVQARVWVADKTPLPGDAYGAGKIASIGVKVDAKSTSEELLGLLEVLNPADEEGKITFITRMGAHRVEEALTPLVRRAARDCICPWLPWTTAKSSTLAIPAGRPGRYGVRNGGVTA